MTKKIINRFREIAAGENNDASDEYYTLYPAFCSLLLELIIRNNKGYKYKKIICPCDSETSIFRELEKKKEYVGNPDIIYSSYPPKDWHDFFDLDYEKEYGCAPNEVCIFTNPPFKGLSKAIREIKCDYLLFGSNAVQMHKNCYAKPNKGFFYKKNNLSFNGNADAQCSSYGRVATVFYSNRPFFSCGEKYVNIKEKTENLFFGKDKLVRIKDEKE